MEIGLKHVLVILSGLTLAVFAKFPAPTSFDTEYNLQPLVEPCCRRVERKRSCNATGLIPIFRKGTRTKLEKQNIRLKAEITDYLTRFDEVCLHALLTIFFTRAS